MSTTVIMNPPLITALNQWSSHPVLVKLYSGSLQEDAQNWLRHIDRQCDRYGIPLDQRIQAALHFMRGDVHAIFSEAVRTLEEEGEELSWGDFKQTLLGLEGVFVLSLSQVIKLNHFIQRTIELKWRACKHHRLTTGAITDSSPG